MDSDRSAQWLGVHNRGEAEAVASILVRARAFLLGARLKCAVTTRQDVGEVYAYVLPDQAFGITLSSGFFQAPLRGFSSRGGTLVHEMSHFVLIGATTDPADSSQYGTGPALERAKSNPSAAQKNAENIEYFVEASGYGL
jgi:peptidyl-Lys metalloendopeptidase